MDSERGAGGPLRRVRQTPCGFREKNLAVEGGEEGDVWMKLLRGVLVGLEV